MFLLFCPIFENKGGACQSVHFIWHHAQMTLSSNDIMLQAVNIAVFDAVDDSYIRLDKMSSVDYEDKLFIAMSYIFILYNTNCFYNDILVSDVYVGDNVRLITLENSNNIEHKWLNCNAYRCKVDNLDIVVNDTMSGGYELVINGKVATMRVLSTGRGYFLNVANRTSYGFVFNDKLDSRTKVTSVYLSDLGIVSIKNNILLFHLQVSFVCEEGRESRVRSISSIILLNVAYQYNSENGKVYELYLTFLTSLFRRERSYITDLDASEGAFGYKYIVSCTASEDYNYSKVILKE